MSNVCTAQAYHITKKVRVGRQTDGRTDRHGTNKDVTPTVSFHFFLTGRKRKESLREISHPFGKTPPNTPTSRTKHRYLVTLNFSVLVGKSGTAGLPYKLQNSKLYVMIKSRNKTNTQLDLCNVLLQGVPATCDLLIAVYMCSVCSQ